MCSKEYYGKIVGHFGYFGYSWAPLEEVKTLAGAKKVADQEQVTSEIGVFRKGVGITVVATKNAHGKWERTVNDRSMS